MSHHAIHRFSMERRLDSLEEFPAHERCMVPGKILACLFDSHDPHIEGIVEYCRDAIHCYLAAAPIAQPTFIHVTRKLVQRKSSSAIQFKRFLNKMRHGRIWQFRLRRALVKVANGSTQGIKSLLQSPIDTLLGFFPKVA